MGRGPSIEARKNAVDAQRGKIFTKIVREISVAARAGGGDPAGNPRLRSAIDKGLAVNMSKDAIERAVKKATGELEGVEYEEVRYEGYAPGGVAVIVDCLTDNKVRTVADVRHAFSKFGGNLGTEGSVAFMFRRLGVLSFAGGADEDRVTEAAIEAGADDVVVSVPISDVMAEADTVMNADGMLVFFAGVPNGTLAPLNLSAVYLNNAQYTGTSGLTIDDQQQVVDLADRGELSPGSIVGAIGGMRAAKDGIAALIEGRYSGKVIIFPQIHDMPLMGLGELKENLPEVAAKLASGDLWTNEAEKALLENYWRG